MKIISLRFKNLNSLRGEWMIDFSNPAFTNAGIFAITGPTGSGKTTILDALCLALYGKTPRLAKISKTSNEVMTRGTGECLAEVVFESQKGAFCCQWSQQRARKKPEGDLQQPRHEISVTRSGEILSVKKNEVLDLIVEKTGMSFEQFTRSMLLAQGGFAAFLQANQDERSPILEQITGTGIYSEISIRVHERTARERLKLEQMQDEIGQIQVFDPEEELRLLQEKETRVTHAEDLEKQIRSTYEAIAWRNKIFEIEQSLQSLNQDYLILQGKKEKAAPEIQILDSARRAAEFETEYTGLSTLRLSEQKEREELQKVLLELPDLRNQAGDAEKKVSYAETVQNDTRGEREREIPVIREIIKLDLRITEGKKQLDAIHSERREKENHIRKNHESLLSAEREQEKILREKEENQTFLTKNAPDSSLQESLSGLKQKIDEYTRLEENIAVKRQKNREITGLIRQAEERCRNHQAELDAEQKELGDSEARLTEIKEKKSGILEGNDIRFWREREAEYRTRSERLSRLSETISRGNDLQGNLYRIGKDDLRIQQLLNTSRANLKIREEEEALRERIVREKEEKLLLLTRIKKYEEDRSHLEDGSPCPLCGSEDHPYARGNTPKQEREEEELEAERSVLRQIKEKILLENVTVTGLETEKNRNTRDRTSLENQIQDIEETWMAEASDLGLDTGTSDRERSLRDATELVRSENDRCRNIIATVEEIDQTIPSLEAIIISRKEKISAVKLALQNAGHDLKNLNNDENRFSEEIKSITANVQQISSALIQSLHPFGYNEISPESAEIILKNLADRRDRYIHQMTNLREHMIRLASLDTDITNRKTALDTSRNELLSLMEQISMIQADYEELSEQRRTTYGDKDPAAEEERLNQAVKRSEENFSAARTEYTVIITKIQSYSDQIRILERRIQDLITDRVSREREFLHQIREKGFQNEDDFAHARVSRETRERLEELDNGIRTEETTISSRISAKTSEREDELKKQLTDLQREDLNIHLGNLQKSLNMTRDEIASLRSRLEDHLQNKELMKTHLTAINAQKREVSRWNLLHELIGSNDGKKFRIFAQGLTFRILISHANRHLRKMTDRYILIQDSVQPLDLSVIDTYQAGEIRTTKNLSGGEGFLVSLALALGLSGMAGRNVRVDSLFLDEGFGTLDDEALDTALGTLAGLEEEGKLIGIISHVPALRERISTRIQVERKSGGISVLIGPGCSQPGRNR